MDKRHIVTSDWRCSKHIYKAVSYNVRNTSVSQIKQSIHLEIISHQSNNADFDVHRKYFVYLQLSVFKYGRFLPWYGCGGVQGFLDEHMRFALILGELYHHLSWLCEKRLRWSPNVASRHRTSCVDVELWTEAVLHAACRILLAAYLIAARSRAKSFRVERELRRLLQYCFKARQCSKV